MLQPAARRAGWITALPQSARLQSITQLTNELVDVMRKIDQVHGGGTKMLWRNESLLLTRFCGPKGVVDILSGALQSHNRLSAKFDFRRPTVAVECPGQLRPHAHGGIDQLNHRVFDHGFRRNPFVLLRQLMQPQPKIMGPLNQGML